MDTPANIVAEIAPEKTFCEFIVSNPTRQLVRHVMNLKKQLKKQELVTNNNITYKEARDIVER